MSVRKAMLETADALKIIQQALEGHHRNFEKAAKRFDHQAKLIEALYTRVGELEQARAGTMAWPPTVH